MILGPSGENIYPEEIENVINNVEGVSEAHLFYTFLYKRAKMCHNTLEFGLWA